MLGLPERNIVIAEGRRAYFSVFTLEEGEYAFTDTDGNTKERAKSCAFYECGDRRRDIHALFVNI